MRKIVNATLFGCSLVSEKLSPTVASELKTRLEEKGIQCSVKDAPLEVGDVVRTTRPNDQITDWNNTARINCKWGIKGRIVGIHDSHGLCYDVQHEGVAAFYDPTEIEEIAT